MGYSVAFDATPLAAPTDDVSGHTLRGIGAYIDGLLRAVVTEEAAWAEEHFRPVITSAIDPPADFALSADRPGLASAYEAAVSRVASGPPTHLVERFSASRSAAPLVAAYEAALD